MNIRNSKLEKYVKLFPWLYYHSVEKVYKCKTCELLPSVGSGSQSQHKFGKVAVKIWQITLSVCFVTMRFLKSI